VLSKWQNRSGRAGSLARNHAHTRGTRLCVCRNEFAFNPLPSQWTVSIAPVQRRDNRVRPNKRIRANERRYNGIRPHHLCTHRTGGGGVQAGGRDRVADKGRDSNAAAKAEQIAAARGVCVENAHACRQGTSAKGAL
jgi:hypothetical protein